MTISSVSSASWLSQLSSTSASSNSVSANRPPAPPPGEQHGGGKLMSAITSTLSELGLTTNSSSNASNSTESADSTAATTSDASQALSAFMQNLMGALRSQHSGAQANDKDQDDGAAERSATQGLGKGRPNIAADLQSLLQQLSSSSNTSSDSSTDTSTELASSFQQLLSSLGGDRSKTTLSDFLTKLASKLPDMGSKGNVVQTQV